MAVSKTYHFPKPREEKPRVAKPIYNKDGRQLRYVDHGRGGKWLDANTDGNVNHYQADKASAYKANTAQNNAMARFAPVDANRKIAEANRDIINARFSARDNALGTGQPVPSRFMNMQKNRPSGSPGIGMLDTPPGVKPMLSNTRPPDLGNPDFIGPQKPGTGWQDRGSSPYQRIMEHKNMLNDPNEKFGPEAYMQNRMNVEDRQSGSAVVYRPEKGSVMRIDPIKKYAGETGTLAEREQFRQAGDLRTAAINQAEAEKQKEYNQKIAAEARKLFATGYVTPEEIDFDMNDPEGSLNRLSTAAGKKEIEGRTASAHQKRMDKWNERFDKNFETLAKTLPPTATPEQREQIYQQALKASGKPPQMPVVEKGGKKGKTGNNLSALRSRARDESLKSQGQAMEVQGGGEPEPKPAPVADKPKLSGPAWARFKGAASVDEQGNIWGVSDGQPRRLAQYQPRQVRYGNKVYDNISDDFNSYMAMIEGLDLQYPQNVKQSMPESFLNRFRNIGPF